MMKRWNIERATKKKVLNKTGGKRFYCGQELETDYIFDDNGNVVSIISRWHVDHVIPLAKGGTYEINNLVPACISCNEQKGTMTADEFTVKRAR